LDVTNLVLYVVTGHQDNHWLGVWLGPRSATWWELKHTLPGHNLFGSNCSLKKVASIEEAKRLFSLRCQRENQSEMRYHLVL
jgi:hypothetical protein